ncbi:MAG: GNAT family N-acetyltransferase [Bacteroidia bacterium]|nr:GNAT family N-acetyltransferase [Bacteroidia bacterium]MCZ2278489.1 GNAT family N-acetyltransferase [Bacteroidia bacterium]
MDDLYKKLEWDTKFLGYPVAQLIPLTFEPSHLANILNELKGKGFRLVYWPSAVSSQKEIDITRSLGGKFVGTKVLYSRNIENYSFKYAVNKLYLMPYNQPEAEDQLIRLAIESGMFSRFKTDDQFGFNTFRKLYTIWIQDSVQKKIAKEVIVSRHMNDITGLITLGEKTNRGDIGLVAVNSKYRGYGISNLLIEYALNWFKNNGYQSVQVATQGNNRPACLLYEKFGFKQEVKTTFFHFWL